MKMKKKSRCANSGVSIWSDKNKEIARHYYTNII